MDNVKGSVREYVTLIYTSGFLRLPSSLNKCICHEHYPSAARYPSSVEFLSLLRTYNCFCEDNKNLQLTYSDNNGNIILDGVLDISWGVHQPIRLQINDEKSIPSPKVLQSPDVITNK
ncbi:hypothetical protein scyTo_0016787, partial [Scyliorhinus torazame]|nr:hypothetical protein [Scyliorhinus torazame]